MMMLVGMSDPGLLILPTHRLVSGFPGLTAETLAERLAPEFEVTVTGEGEAGCRAAWEAIESGGDQDVLGFGTVADGRWLIARLRSDAAMDRLAPDHSPEWRSLGVSILHVLVLDNAAQAAGHGLVPLRPPAPRGPRRRRRPAAATWPASSPPRGWSTSRRSPRTSRPCRPRAPISIPSCSPGWCSTPCGVWIPDRSAPRPGPAARRAGEWPARCIAP